MQKYNIDNLSSCNINCKTKVSFITILLPIRNEELYIYRTLKSVLSQEYPNDRMEVLVVDGMSTDKTRQIVNKISIEHPQVKLLLLDNPAGIVPSAINIGLRNANGEIIIRVDGHCEISSNYVAKCVMHIKMDNVSCVGGSIITVGDTFKSKTIALSMSSSFGVGGSAFRTVKDKQMFVDTVPFPAYTKEIIQRGGDFDEELLCNEDDEYNYRLRELGERILLAADINSRYYCRSSLFVLWKQYFKYGLWKVRLLQKHPHQMQSRQFVPPLFEISLFLTFIFSIFNKGGHILFLSIIVLYMITNLLSSLWVAYKNKSAKYIFLLPITFAILHLSYGSGFLTGLIKFADKWDTKSWKFTIKLKTK